MQRLFLAGLALVASAAACAPPLQNGGVAMFPGVAERVGMICRWRHGDVASDTMCVPPDERIGPARVRVIASDEDKLRGPFANGAKGDLLLENDEVAFVIDRVGRGSGLSEGGGHLVDAADARARKDELGELETALGDKPAVVETLTNGVDADGAAWVEARGHAATEPSLAVITRFTLARDSRALLITTTLTSQGTAPLAPMDLGDVVGWGSAAKIAPDKELGFTGAYDGKLIGAIGREVSYVLVPDAGALTSKNGVASSRLTYGAKVALRPGESVTYARNLLVTARGDGLAVATELFYASGGSPGGFEVELVDERGQRVEPPRGARVDVRATVGSKTSPIPTWFAIGEPASPIVASSPSAAPTSNAPLGAELAPGRYALSFSGGGRRSRAEAEVDVSAGHVARARLVLTEPRTLAVDLTSDGTTPTPAKLQIFDPNGKAIDGPLFALGGHADVPLAPGRYKIVASRGPEFEVATSDVDLTTSNERVSLKIRRVVDTRGFVACDFHLRSSKGGDSAVSAAERLASSVASGVELVALGGPNRVVDPTPIARALGVLAYVATLPAEEIVSDSATKPFGRFDVFPWPLDAVDARGGALPTRDATAASSIDALRQRQGERVIQVTHARGPLGYFDLFGLDPKTGVGGAGYDARFDALEIWSGRSIADRSRLLEDLWTLLRTSHPVTPTAGSGALELALGEAGAPRTYVAVADDDPSKLDPAAVVASLRSKRDVIVTNGPFVTMRAGEVEQGGMLSLSQPQELVIRVQRPRWIDANRLTIVVGGASLKPIPLPGVEAADGGLVDEIHVKVSRTASKAKGKKTDSSKTNAIELTDDTFLVAVVTGDRPETPVLSPGADPAEIAPFAMTAPLWIDVDGDGKSLGR